MRRTALVLVLLVAAFGVVAAGCGQEEDQTATPETVEGTTTTETTETETTETETTETETEPTETETTETETTPAVEGDPVAGKAVFLGSSSCGGCHTLADAGSSGAVGPNLDDAMPSNERALEIITNGQGGMPSFSSTLSEQQIADVAAYVSSVAGS
ncbi:MAG TPA: cytochrome c [Gaiellaceae bacterium]|nr:cytochrome c [Gaiellaceae bacterium]